MPFTASAMATSRAKLSHSRTPRKRGDRDVVAGAAVERGLRERARGFEIARAPRRAAPGSRARRRSSSRRRRRARSARRSAARAARARARAARARAARDRRAGASSRRPARRPSRPATRSSRRGSPARSARRAAPPEPGRSASGVARGSAAAHGVGEPHAPRRETPRRSPATSSVARARACAMASSDVSLPLKPSATASSTPASVRTEQRRVLVRVGVRVGLRLRAAREGERAAVGQLGQAERPELRPVLSHESDRRAWPQANAVRANALAWRRCEPSRSSARARTRDSFRARRPSRSCGRASCGSRSPRPR